jgi:hypothetical protein
MIVEQEVKVDFDCCIGNQSPSPPGKVPIGSGVELGKA